MHIAYSPVPTSSNNLVLMVLNAIQTLPSTAAMHVHYYSVKEVINLLILGSIRCNIEGIFSSLKIAAPKDLSGRPSHCFKKFVNMSNLGCLYGDYLPSKTATSHSQAHISQPYSSAGTTFNYNALTKAMGKLPNPACTSLPFTPYILCENSSRQGKNYPLLVILSPKKRKLYSVLIL